jgi:hypothetical protein
MEKVLTVVRMSAADAVSLNEKVQTTVTDGIARYGEEAVGAPVIAAAAELKTETSALEQVEAATFQLRKEVDTSEDRCHGAIINHSENVVLAYESTVVPLTEPQAQQFASAQFILDRCFPYGRGFIIGRWSEQFGVTEMVLKTADLPEAKPHIERLGLTDLFDLLKKTHAVYGERMGFTALKPGDTESPLYRWHEALEAYLGAVVFTQKKNPELKAKLTAPYNETAKAIRDARKRAQKQTETIIVPEV